MTTQITGEVMGRLATLAKTVARFERVFADRFPETGATAAGILEAPAFTVAQARLADLLGVRPSDTGGFDLRAEIGETPSVMAEVTEASTFATPSADRAARHARRSADAKAAVAAAPEAAAKPKRTAKPKPAAKVSKTSVLIEMLRRPDGATAAEIRDSLGWAVSGATRRSVERAGFKFVAAKDEAGVRRFFATEPVIAA